MAPLLFFLIFLLVFAKIAQIFTNNNSSKIPDESTKLLITQIVNDHREEIKKEIKEEMRKELKEELREEILLENKSKNF